MSWKHQLSAARRQAHDAGRDLAHNARQRADTVGGDSERAKASRRLAASAAERVQAAAGWTRQRVDDGLDRAGDTRTAGQVAQSTRRAGQTMRNLPGFSATLDTIMEKNGVDALRSRLQDDPGDPMRYIQLATALQRTQRDLRSYAAARTVINPGSIVMRQLMRTAAGLDTRSEEPAHTQLLRQAFHLAKQQLAEDPTDAHALHALARIYLLQRQPHHAVRFAKRAARAERDDCGLPLVTLSRAYLDLDQPRPARRAAEMAVGADMTLGYEILATTTRHDEADSTTSPRQREADLLARVSQDDRQRYDGFATTPAEISRAVAASQRDKTHDLSQKITTGTRQLQQKVSRRLRAAKDDKDASPPPPASTSSTP